MTREISMHNFQTPDPVKLRVELWQGRVTVLASETGATTVELSAMLGDSHAQELIDQATVEQRGDEIVVLLPRPRRRLFQIRGGVRAVITVPVGSDALVHTGSADVETKGRLGRVSTHGGSGDVELEHVARAQVQTGSGDIQLGTVEGDCDARGGSADVSVRTIGGDAEVITGSGDIVIGEIAGALKVKTGSGDISVNRAGHADLTSTSGDIEAGEITGGFRAVTGSGDVTVRQAGDTVDATAGSGDLSVARVDHGRVRAKTASGDILVGVAQGSSAYLDVSTVTGDVTSSLDASDAPRAGEPQVELFIQAVTGDVVLRRA
ncbi:DUF4097 family beta strand repeat-containing protein [Phenylobacterium sp.]|uniref:DUF4097 family beta strand repeat-containing protein n=1 Tax=Phenylobacterium sp. TaxID=1871053 RepID=UPI002720AA64|nr:DUF4097 family beta strand repeat-containing protein [Phenylobacterium sp.]MDO8380697.1 DUF4097 family beta strand repeat-containing protein [Phenylobacterium sp.]